MSHLALNTVLAPLLRVRYQVTLGLAPVGLMFAALWPGLLLASWVEKRLGIAPNTPFNAIPHGASWIIGFLFLLVVFMIFGYALGWFVNQAVSRWILGWSPEMVRSVYAHSDVPNHWLKSNTGSHSDATAQSAATRKE